MKAFIYILAVLAVICFGAALLGYSHQAVIGAMAALTAYTLGAELKSERDEQKSKEIE